MTTPSNTELDSSVPVVHEMTTLAERLAAQLERTSGNEYRWQLARAHAFALCDLLHAFDAAR